MHEGIQIRAMTVDDLSAATALWEQTEGIAAPLPNRVLCRMLGRNPDCCQVATQAGRVVGAILATTDGRMGLLQQLAVASEARRQGVGRLLVQAAIAALNAIDITFIWLLVYKENEKAAVFWQSLGFEIGDHLHFMYRRT